MIIGQGVRWADEVEATTVNFVFAQREPGRYTVGLWIYQWRVAAGVLDIEMLI